VKLRYIGMQLRNSFNRSDKKVIDTAEWKITNHKSESKFKDFIDARDYSDDFTIDRRTGEFNNFVLPPEYDEFDIAIDGDTEAMMKDGTIVNKITIDEYLRDNSTTDSTQYIEYQDNRLIKKWAKGNKK
jgi:hypothetical protein